ncbi:MAG TPA: response regulator transcription factor [Chakrabartia sp.]|jgi:two-component system OmpR family response regulator|nr:response regulator transcription factor [Chakrabartia sp.]
MRVLVIEDDMSLRDHIANALEEAGHIVDRQADGRSGLIAATQDPFDAIILDRMLPHVDGLKLLRTLRASGDSTPILILSALSDVDERVRGLQAGGDDYLTKPFAMAELLARIEVLQRRPPLTEAPQSAVSIGSLTVDLLGQLVTRDGRRIHLTAREYRILLHLARNVGRVVTRSMLLEAVWDYQFDPQTNIIDQHVSKLRQKLDAGAREPLIHTVRGSGYVLRPDR